MARSSKIAIMVLAVGLGWSPALAEEPIEYVRVCDAYGAGFFYIPGTETCLRVGAFAHHSRIDNPSGLSVGTFLRGIDQKGPLVGLPDSIWRTGGGFTFDLDPRIEVDFGRANAYLTFGGRVTSARGRARQWNDMRISLTGVTDLGYTFLENQGTEAAPDTGVLGSFPGLGMVGYAGVVNRWHLGEFDAQWHFPKDLSGDGRGDAALSLTTGIAVEEIRFDSMGRSQMTFEGAPFTGFFQDYDYQSRDFYFLSNFGAEFSVFPTDRLRFTAGAGIQPGYHRGTGSISMETGVGGGNVVSEEIDFRRSGFVMGAWTKASAEAWITPNLSLSLGVRYDRVPAVTSFAVPHEPDLQPGRFSSRSVNRFGINAGLRAAF